MSGEPATYAFLPWLRRGMASEITRVDRDMTGAPRADVSITLEIDAGGEIKPVTAPLELFGPGEVGAVDQRVIIRFHPKPGEIDAEPNFMPAVEFDQADFPWRYTPARADSRSRLRPWLVLAVLTADEIVEEAPAGGDGRLPSVTVTSAAALPRLGQSWAWAHVQVEGFDPSSENLAAVVREQTHRVRSRLLAPRRLLPKTEYRAVLIPAFERGRLAGLNEPLNDTIDGLTPAWTDNAMKIRLPVYVQWSFQTGTRGDFEYLARSLRARAVDDALGLCDMDVSAPDPALPAASAGFLAYEGALVSPAARSTPWPEQERTAFAAEMQAVLNQPAEALENEGAGKTVAPPLWCRWHAARDRLSAQAAARPVWFHELNTDPRLRVCAGLGAEIIRRNDQQLMAAAWDQVAGVNEANAELRRAQLAREAAEKLYTKHILKLDTEKVLAVTAPMQPHFKASPVTVHEVLRRSPIPRGTLDGQMRRLMRPAGPIAKRLKRSNNQGGTRLLSQLNSGRIRPQPPSRTPEAMMSPGKVVSETTPFGQIAEQYRLWATLCVIGLLLSLLFFLSGAAGFAATALIFCIGLGVAAHRGRNRARREQLQRAIVTRKITPDEVRAMTPDPEFIPAVSKNSGHLPKAPRAMAAESHEAMKAAHRFQSAFVELTAEIGAAPAKGEVRVSADLPKLSGILVKAMNPRLTIPAALTHRLKVAGWVTWTFDDPLEPVMAAPEFDAPMYEPLRDYSQQWLMPGVGRIPPDTVTLVKSNQRFIEAYMGGLSHEMARELLYHEYPTDQRGTYFRQFWDVRGVMEADGTPRDPDTLGDILPIHTWNRDEGLGRNPGSTPAPRDGHLVFLIKGELLRRYPGTMVYAVKTIIGTNGRRTLGEEERFPVFEGRLDPDIIFFGFDLLPDEVHGDPHPASDQGWYFMLQEPIGEPLFGLDADDGRYAVQPASWNDLNWAQLAVDENSLSSLGYIDLDADLPDTTNIASPPGEPVLAWHAEHGLGASGANASDLAHITLQRPFRVAIHGSDMLTENLP